MSAWVLHPSGEAAVCPSQSREREALWWVLGLRAAAGERRGSAGFVRCPLAGGLQRGSERLTRPRGGAGVGLSLIVPLCLPQE